MLTSLKAGRGWRPQGRQYCRRRGHPSVALLSGGQGRTIDMCQRVADGLMGLDLSVFLALCRSSLGVTAPSRGCGFQVAHQAGNLINIRSEKLLGGWVNAHDSLGDVR